VRAVNLITVEDRRSAGAPGRTGGAVYVALGILAVVVLATAAYAVTTNQVNQRKADLAKTTLEANATEAQAAAVKPYADFAQLKNTRLETVQSLAENRFDWHAVMDQFSRAIPSNVWLTAFKGNDGQAAPGAAGATGTPSVDIAGCTTNHKDVARLMTRLRLIEGVSNVSLSASEKGAGGGGGGGAQGGDCTNGHADYPMFTMSISFAAPSAAAAQPSAPSTTQPASTGGTP